MLPSTKTNQSHHVFATTRIHQWKGAALANCGGRRHDAAAAAEAAEEHSMLVWRCHQFTNDAEAEDGSNAERWQFDKTPARRRMGAPPPFVAAGGKAPAAAASIRAEVASRRSLLEGR